MFNILFICTANQFRSPLAEAFFRRNLSILGIEDQWIVGSAGTWATTGLPAHPKAIETAAKVGLDIKAHRTREIDTGLIQDVDIILVMQYSHKEALEIEFPSKKNQIFLLGQLAKIHGDEIPDPAMDGFSHPDETVKLIRSCIDRSFSFVNNFCSTRRNPPNDHRL